MTEIISNAICLVLFLGLGVSTPQGTRYNEGIVQNERYSEFNVPGKYDERALPYDVKYKPNEVMEQESQRNLLFQNEGYNQNAFEGNKGEITLNTRRGPLNPSITSLAQEQNPRFTFQEYQRAPVLNNNEIRAINNEQRILNQYPEDYKNINIQRNTMPQDKEEILNVERNINNVKDLAPQVLYRPSVPQGNRIHNFRPNYEENREINVPGVGASISQSNNNRNINLPKVNPISQISHINQRLNLPVERLANNMDRNNDEDGIQIDVPIATPEYIHSILNEYKHTTQRSLDSLNGMKNENTLLYSTKNIEGTFQNPSAEILYKTGRAKPYEISTEQVSDLPQGHARVENILSNPQRLKHLYLSSKPSKRYMVVYPNGRVEQVDELEHIQKNYPNYVMLQAKELLQKNQVNPITTSEIRDSAKPVLSTTTPIQPINPTIDTEINQVNKIASQTAKDQIIPVTTDSIIGPSKNAKDLSSDIKVERAETEPIKTNEAQTPVEEVSSHNENVISTPQITQGQNILDKNKKPSAGYNEIISTTEIPLKEEIVTTTKNTVSIEPETSGNNQISDNQDQFNISVTDKSPEIDSLPTNLEKVRDNNTKPNKSAESNENYEDGNNSGTSSPETSSPNRNTELSNQSSPDISSSPSPPELSQNTEASNRNVSNEKRMADEDDDSNEKTPSPEIKKKYDEENLGSIPPSTESDINSPTSEATSLFSPVNPETTDSTLTKTSIENQSDSITDNNPLLPNGSEVVYGEEAPNLTQPESITSTSSQGDNYNTSEVQTPDVNDDATYKDASPIRNNSESIPHEDDVSLEESDLNKKPSLSPKQNVSSFDEELNPISKESVNEYQNSPIDGVKGTVVNSSPSSGLTASNNEESAVPVAASNDSYYQNPVSVEEKPYEAEDDKEETVTSKSNDKLQTDVSKPSASTENTDTEPSWFNFNEILLKKLLSNDDLHNSFYFLFPRPKPNIRETKKTIYPNGTVIIETTQTIDADDGERTTSKSTQRCVSCKTCDST